MVATIINTLLFLIFIFYLISIRKKYKACKYSVDTSFKTLDVYLKKRYDLVPKLLETLKGVLISNEKLLIKIKELVKYEYPVLSKTEKLKLNGRITTGLKKLYEACEFSDELLSNKEYIQIKKQIDETEDDIEKTRKNYNHHVTEYNNLMQKMPSCFFASLMGFNNEMIFDNISHKTKEANDDDNM